MANTLIDHFFARYFPLLLILGGILFFIFSFFRGPQEGYFNGYRLMATGIFLGGIGEWLNHPQQVSLSLANENSMEATRKSHRKRNPSSVGNLLDIAALILLCVGFSKSFL